MASPLQRGRRAASRPPRLGPSKGSGPRACPPGCRKRSRRPRLGRSGARAAAAAAAQPASPGSIHTSWAPGRSRGGARCGPEAILEARRKMDAWARGRRRPPRAPRAPGAERASRAPAGPGLCRRATRAGCQVLMTPGGLTANAGVPLPASRPDPPSRLPTRPVAVGTPRAVRGAAAAEEQASAGACLARSLGRPLRAGAETAFPRAARVRRPGWRSGPAARWHYFGAWDRGRLRPVIRSQECHARG